MRSPSPAEEADARSISAPRRARVRSVGVARLNGQEHRRADGFGQGGGVAGVQQGQLRGPMRVVARFQGGGHLDSRASRAAVKARTRPAGRSSGAWVAWMGRSVSRPGVAPRGVGRPSRTPPRSGLAVRPRPPRTPRHRLGPRDRVGLDLQGAQARGGINHEAPPQPGDRAPISTRGASSPVAGSRWVTATWVRLGFAGSRLRAPRGRGDHRAALGGRWWGSPGDGPSRPSVARRPLLRIASSALSGTREVSIASTPVAGPPASKTACQPSPLGATNWRGARTAPRVRPRPRGASPTPRRWRPGPAARAGRGGVSSGSAAVASAWGTLGCRVAHPRRRWAVSGAKRRLERAEEVSPHRAGHLVARHRIGVQLDVPPLVLESPGGLGHRCEGQPLVRGPVDRADRRRAAGGPPGGQAGAWDVAGDGDRGSTTSLCRKASSGRMPPWEKPVTATRLPPSPKPRAGCPVRCGRRPRTYRRSGGVLEEGRG